MAKQIKIKETPLMKQYNQIKGKYPDAILLFRVGDFYETFGSDAITVAKVLDIVLTKRANGSNSHIELAGFPYHALDNYLPRLVEAGFRVAVCDQLEAPSKGKKIVKRGITEIVTPGVTTNDRVLRAKSNNFLAAVCRDKNRFGVSFIEVSTGDYFIVDGDEFLIQKMLHTFAPTEVLINRNDKTFFTDFFEKKYYIYYLDDWIFATSQARDLLHKHFKTKSLKGFGISEISEGVIAAGAALHYVYENQQEKVPQIQKIEQLASDKYIWIDPFTTRNLELIHPQQPEGKTLLDILDKTATPMGGRRIKNWITLPLIQPEAIQKRLDMVEYLVDNGEKRQQIRDLLSRISDIERLTTKIATTRIRPNEFNILTQTLEQMQHLKQIEFEQIDLRELTAQLSDMTHLYQKIKTNINPDAPVLIQKGGVIAMGVLPELDEYRHLASSAKQVLEELCQREIEHTGITSLKIGFNNVFGYFFEVRNTHKESVPEAWERKQTLVSAERYVNSELKDLEQRILTAEERISDIEQKLYFDFVVSIQSFIPSLQADAQIIATMDCLLSFAISAYENQYVKPEINDSLDLEVEGGRHPVIEKLLPHGEKYIANPVSLNQNKEQIALISGPNMSGKSAYLRQNALLIIMAQMGCFVPATKAKIGLIDRIFSRVGASDNLASGESTFMVEMNETANILNNLSGRSLILLDEIGRGTSTYDGISIAWAIVEYLHEHPYKPKTLFATHYHELNELANQMKGVHNLNVEVKELNGEIHFSRKIIPGHSQQSFGINVAKIASVPNSVTKRAYEILAELEQQHKPTQIESKPNKDAYQLKLFEYSDAILESIKQDLTGLEINGMTPMEALMKLSEYQNQLKK